MKFTEAEVKGVKADLAKGEITLSFVIPIDQQAAADDLAKYVGENGEVELVVTPRQLPMKL